MQSTNQLSAETLGQIALIQGMVAHLPNQTSILSFVCRGLEIIPGAGKVSYHIFDPESDKQKLQAETQKTLNCFPIMFKDFVYGALLFQLSDPDLFKPYIPYLENLSHMLGVIFEERNQRNLNKIYKDDLEKRVYERTIQLEKEIKKHLKAKEALQESEERFRAAFDSAQDCVLIWDENYNYLYANQAAIDHVGTTSDKVIGKNIRDGLRHVPDFMHLWMTRIDQVFKTGERLRVQDKQEIQGRLYYTDSILSPIRDSKGHVFSVCVVYRDVTELQRAQEALKKNEERLSIALKGSNSGIWDWNVKTGEIFFDDNYYLISGYEPNEFPYSYEEWKKRVHPDDIENAEREIKAYISGEIKDYAIEFRFKTKKNDWMWILGQGKIFEYDDEGNPSRFTGTHLDITKRKQAEEESGKLESQLRQAAKIETVGTLAGGIAHDFNNILGIIIGNTELAMDDVPDWNPARINLEEIKVAGLRARDVVRQLLSFSRKSDHEKKPIKIQNIVKESIQLLRASIPTTIEFRANIPSDLKTILADPIQIHQIIINLCTNAAHAMEENGGILGIHIDEVDLDEDTAKYLHTNTGSYVQLNISDTGCGIKPEIKDRIFDPYFTTKEVGKGTGIGLSVVYRIIKNHGGAISVYSEPNRGTTIKVLFPVIDEKPVEETETSEKEPKGNEKILLIDDEESLIKMERQILERLGYQVEARTDPIDALELFCSNPKQFDLIITDMTMPSMTGVKLAKQILEARPDIPIILCTGFSEKINKESVLDIGIRKYIEKPINKRELSIAIRELLNKQ